MLNQAAKDDFQRAHRSGARAQANDHCRRIRDILDKEERRNERQRELDEGERAIQKEEERRRLDEREEHGSSRTTRLVERQREREDRIKQKMADEAEAVADHMAMLNFQREMTKTERQLVAEDRRYKAAQKAKRDAHHRFKLQQKIDRETAKAEHIAHLRNQMREDAVRTNVLEAERRRPEREAARKELHGTYAEAATPKSFTRGTRVCTAKSGSGKPERSPSTTAAEGGEEAPGEEERCDQTRARCRRGGSRGADYDYESREIRRPRGEPGGAAGGGARRGAAAVVRVRRAERTRGRARRSPAVRRRSRPGGDHRAGEARLGGDVRARRRARDLRTRGDERRRGGRGQGRVRRRNEDPKSEQ